MGGRGKPRRAKSPKLNLKETTGDQQSPVSVTHTTFEEEKQNETTKRPKKRDQQRQKQTEEKPSAPQTVRRRTANHFTEAANNQQDVPADSTKTKKYSARKKSVETTPGDATHTQLKPDTPKDIVKTPPKIPEVRPPHGKAKLQAHFTEDLTNTEVQPVQKIKTQASTAAATNVAAANKRAKTCANKAGRTEVQPDRSEESLPGRTGDKERIIRKTLDKLKIKQVAKAEAAHVINDFMKNLIKYLKRKSDSFREVEEPLRTGSYYENLKVSLFCFLNIFSEHVIQIILILVVSYTILIICKQISNPDEFDVMLPIPVDRVQIDPFGSNGAFYSVQLKRGPSQLKKFQQNILSSSEMLEEFREEVETFAKDQSGQ